jgi:hypothetical protein
MLVKTGRIMGMLQAGGEASILSRAYFLHLKRDFIETSYKCSSP